MKKLTGFLTDKFIHRGIIDPTKKEIYQTGLELIFSDIINFFLILIFGLITNSFWYSCLYIFIIVSVRRFSGGFHAKTYSICRIVTVGTYLMIALFNRIITSHQLIFTVSFNITVIITMLLFAPIRHPNKELTSTEVKANRFFALIITLLFSMASVTLVSFEIQAGMFISLSLLAVAVLMYAGLLVNRKEEKTNG